MIGASNNSDRQTVLTTICESSVPAGKRLVVSLSSRLRISSAISSVNNRIAKVLIILITTGEDY